MEVISFDNGTAYRILIARLGRRESTLERYQSDGRIAPEIPGVCQSRRRDTFSGGGGGEQNYRRVCDWFSKENCVDACSCCCPSFLIRCYSKNMTVYTLLYIYTLHVYRLLLSQQFILFIRFHIGKILFEHLAIYTDVFESVGDTAISNID